MTKKFGVIAVGGNRTHQESYAREFAADPRCELVGVADEPGLPEYREELNRLLASELGVPYLTLDEALARDDVQIIDNCADVERRARVAVKTLEAGKHLYMDKPLAGSVEDAKAIADAADKSDAVTQMFTQVTTSWAQSAKSAVESGQTGEVLGLHCDMLMAKGKPGSVDPSVVRREKPSDGTFTHVEAKRELFDMGVYPVALVQWLSGARTKDGLRHNRQLLLQGARGSGHRGLRRSGSHAGQRAGREHHKRQDRIHQSSPWRTAEDHAGW